MKYDDSEYLFLNFETELDNDAAATHIGMYLAWAILRGLADADFAQSETALKAKQTTGGAVLLDRCDGKLTDDDFNELGNAFTQAYYERYFIKDYERVFSADFPNTGHPTDDFCGIADSWANFDRIAAILDRRFAQWQQARSTQAQAKSVAQATPQVPPPTANAKSTSTPLALEQMALEPMAAASPEELRRRGESGDAEAWYELAAQLLTGEGTKQDVAGGIEAFRRAAELGHLESTYNLGVAYQNGDGVPKDASLALQWFARAADRGHGFATFMLAQAYRAGTVLPSDLALSNALSMLAVHRGVREANRFGVIAGHPYADIAIAMSKPGAMQPVLEARSARKPQAIPAQAAPPNQSIPRKPIAARVSAQTNTEQGPATDSAKPANAWNWALLATAIGAIGLFVLLFFAISLSRPTFLLLMYGFALIGAIGVFFTSRAAGASRAMQIILTLGAAIPGIGSFVCMLVLYRWWSSPQDAY